MEFFCSSRCCPKKKGEYAQLRAQKKSLHPVHRGRKELAELLGCWLGLLAGLCWLRACWLCWLGFAGCRPAALSFQQPVCCYCFIFLFLLLFHGKLLGALCPLYSILACELFQSLNPVVCVERIIWALWASVACGPLILLLFILFSP